MNPEAGPRFTVPGQRDPGDPMGPDRMGNGPDGLSAPTGRCFKISQTKRPDPTFLIVVNK